MKVTSERGGERGSATISVLVFSSVLSVVAVAAVTIVLAGVSVSKRIDRAAEREEAVSAEVRWVIEQLAEDPTPEADSPFDPVWGALETRSASISLRDVSSAVNPNWIRPTFLARSGLEEMLLTKGRGAAELSQFRIDEGISVAVARWYEDFFEPDTIERYLTGYGLFNINVTHEAVLRDLYALRTGSSGGAETFLAQVQEALRGVELWDDEELRQLLGVEYENVYPVINTAPVFNVHFLDEEVLEAVVTYPYGGEPIPASATAAAVLLEERARDEITDEELRNFLAIQEDGQDRLFAYLGTKTWFWRIEVETEYGAGSAIVLRVPAPESAIGPTTEPPVFRVVEWTIGS